MKPATKEEINQIYPRFKSQADGVDYVRDGLENHEGELIMFVMAWKIMKASLLLYNLSLNILKS